MKTLRKIKINSRFKVATTTSLLISSLFFATHGQSFADSTDSVTNLTATEVFDKLKKLQEEGSDSLDISNAYKSVHSNKKTESVNTLLTYAKKGNPEAENLMGILYSNGTLTAPGDLGASKRRANQWFLIGAKNGNGFAAYNRALSYTIGETEKEDMPMAAPLFTEAWEKEHIVQAAVRLSFWYYKAQNYSEAWVWAKRAAMENKKYGSFLLGKMQLNGQGVQPSRREAIGFFQQSLEGYNGHAARTLAWIYSMNEPGNNPQQACAYEVIANHIEGRIINTFCNTASKENRDAGKAYATSWIATHTPPLAIDYTSQLTGLD